MRREITFGIVVVTQCWSFFCYQCLTNCFKISSPHDRKKTWWKFLSLQRLFSINFSSFILFNLVSTEDRSFGSKTIKYMQIYIYILMKKMGKVYLILQYIIFRVHTFQTKVVRTLRNVEAYLEPSRTSITDLFFRKQLTVFKR